MDDRPIDETLPEHVAANREAWDRYAVEYIEPGHRAWAHDVPTWGIWGVPESELHLLPDDLDGKDAIELGCGTAYVSAWLARRGARPVGIDNSPAQLATARRFQEEFGLEFPVHLGNAEATPFPDASFDVAISEYGAALWADPYAWIPEAARLLRPGGRLVFLTNGLILQLCVEELVANDPAKRPSGGRSSACIGPSGPMTPRSSSTCPTASGSASFGSTASRSSDSSRSRRPTTPSTAPSTRT